MTRGPVPALVLALLAVDGVVVAVLGALFLPLRIGAIPFPLTALLAGAMNAALVWVALKWTDSGRLAALPLWAWLATVAVLTLGGPGGDIVFGGAGVMAYSALFYLVLGAGPAAWLLWWR
ncbi:hypothetical protein [Mycolicibacterium sp. F2034L]|uniref:hypothetical protein n=1 Tax=Mycolicibacterium sp. F2034L TaxID=2926422 RepID=UPI001FF121BF|nr:hypothetical protein [Mycolicibacterium sp. F2034L]MCK0173077.1 hypothetical protein [Mycolicibacterium sp. F2034L]